MNTSNINYHTFIGIDISKKDFVCAIHDKVNPKTYINNKKGWQQFVTDHLNILSKSLVVVETTGGYEMGLLLYLLNNDIAVHRADTRKVKNFIRSWGKYGKTDKIDSQSIALYAYERQTHLSIYKPQEVIQIKLKALVERRGDLVKILVQEKNRSQAPTANNMYNSFETIINILKQEIAEIERKINNLIESDEIYIQKRQVLLTMPGVGIKTANTLLTMLPELGKISRKQVASLCGVAPHPKQSGQRTWYSATTSGRRNLRPILFLSAMSASKTKSRLGAFYKSLIERGKNKLVALVALMRKMLVILNAKLRDFYASTSLLIS